MRRPRRCDPAPAPVIDRDARAGRRACARAGGRSDAALAVDPAPAPVVDPAPAPVIDQTPVAVEPAPAPVGAIPRRHRWSIRRPWRSSRCPHRSSIPRRHRWSIRRPWRSSRCPHRSSIPRRHRWSIRRPRRARARRPHRWSRPRPHRSSSPASAPVVESAPAPAVVQPSPAAVEPAAGRGAGTRAGGRVQECFSGRGRLRFRELGCGAAGCLGLCGRVVRFDAGAGRAARVVRHVACFRRLRAAERRERRLRRVPSERLGRSAPVTYRSDSCQRRPGGPDARHVAVRRCYAVGCAVVRDASGARS